MTKNNDYQAKQEIARRIESYANTTRNSGSYHELAFNCMDKFVSEIAKLDAFADKVASTIYKSMNPYNFKVAAISSKQAWILACAAVENNVELN